jgi:nucleoside-diphosphate-sugar epimerase
VGDLSHLSKLYVEQLARMLAVPFVSVRLGVTYGLAPIMKDDPSFMTVPNVFCLRAVQNQPLRVLEDRPMAFIHVHDAVRALLAAADLPTRETWQAVNAATEVLTIGQVAQTVAALARARGLAPRVESTSATAVPTFAVSSRLGTRGFRGERTAVDSLGEVLAHFSHEAARAA